MPPKRGHPIVATVSTVSPKLIELLGNLRLVRFTSERGASYLVPVVGGVSVADACAELMGSSGHDSVRLVIYGGGE